jgi:hypothetical protein
MNENITWSEDVNMFADLTPEEIKQYNGVKYDEHLSERLSMAV